jgi:hypothetical protein
LAHSELLEVTITHNLPKAEEVLELHRRHWIALDWGRKGPDPAEYTRKARTDVELFHKMREQGAAVIAAYKKAPFEKPSHRLVGLVKAGTEFEYFEGLLCLPLSEVQIVDSSSSFLGNLAPRQCTIQLCGNRARGRLAALASGQASPPSVELLHHLDVEWLVTNYLMVTRICQCIWSGSRSFEDIDHAGSMPDGRELLAQTTVSAGLVQKKAERLLKYADENRALYFFGPEASESQCPEGIIYHSIESVFQQLLQVTGGKWLIDRMLSFANNQVGEEPIPPGFVRLGVPTMTRAEAAASIREIQKNHTLGGLKIKDLIEEGRRC